MRTMPLFLGICLLARVTFGAEPIVSFAKQSLGLDLASFSFGTKAQTKDAYIKVDAPLSAQDMVNAPGVTWMTNPVSDKYKHDFPNRVLRYGFRDGRLVAVRISINSFVDAQGHMQDQATIDRQRKELLQIQDELIKARHSPGENSFRIREGAMCAPSPDSLFLMELQITPVEKKTAS